MVNKVSLAGFVIIALLLPQHAAASRPSIEGQVDGVELCPQFICDSAIFIGQFDGRVNGRRAAGGFFVSINHDELPAPNVCADINGGNWTIRANLRFFSGEVISGTIFNTGNNTFGVDAVLEINFGGDGPIYVQGILDHTTSIPTIIAALTQEQPPSPCATIVGR